MTESSDGPDPTRVVADADVLAADLLVGRDARAALDHVRRHSWMTLVASEPLLAEATAVIDRLGGDVDPSLSADWRDQVRAECLVVEQEPDDHPALASAAAGNAAHLLTFDGDLASAGANLALQAHLRVSIRSPAAFAATFEPGALYEVTVGEAYQGPDSDPRD